MVGRGSTTDLCLSDSSLSREHAVFTRSGSRVDIEDLGSKNGAFVGGRKVGRRSVAAGDEVWLGRVLVTLHEAHPRREADSHGAGLHEAILLALDASGIGVALLNGDGVCVHHNSRVSALFETADGIYLDRDRLAIATPNGQTWLQGVLAEFRGDVDDVASRQTATISIPRRQSPRALVLRALNHPSATDDKEALAESYLAVICLDPDCPAQIDPTWLRGAYNITSTESEVANALLSGHTPRDIAAARGVSLETVRTHLKHLYAKTDTRRQADLVRVLLRTSGCIWG